MRERARAAVLMGVSLLSKLEPKIPKKAASRYVGASRANHVGRSWLARARSMPYFAKPDPTSIAMALAARREEIARAPTQHPAAQAEEEFQRHKMRIYSQRRQEQLRKLERSNAAAAQREVQLQSYYARTRMSAAEEARKKAEAAAYLMPQFNLLPPTPSPAAKGFPPATAPGGSASQSQIPQLPSIHKNQQAARKKATPSPGVLPSKQPAADSEQLSSAQCVRVVLDILYLKIEDELIARGSLRRGEPKSLEQTARDYIKGAEEHIDEESLAVMIVPNGLLGLRIGCAECDPHPTVILFQRLMGWRGPPIKDPMQLDALWIMLLWLLPDQKRMKRAVVAQIEAAVKGKGGGARLGGAKKYEPMPPRTTVGFEGIPRVLALLGEKRKLENKYHFESLLEAAENLIEYRSRKRGKPGGAEGFDGELSPRGAPGGRGEGGGGGDGGDHRSRVAPTPPATGSKQRVSGYDGGTPKRVQSPRQQLAKQRVLDVEELMLYWADTWYTWRKYFTEAAVPQVDSPAKGSHHKPAKAGSLGGGLLPPYKRVRVDREELNKRKIELKNAQSNQMSDRRKEAQGVNQQRYAAMAQVEANAPWIGGPVSGKRDTGLDDVVKDGQKVEEDFAYGMRQNAMEFDVVDVDRDKKLDFDEFVAFIKQRERGPHSDFELRARFDSLDADHSGQIDLHEFIRFSLRDALARAAARVMDLLREWDTDGNGQIDRKEFRRAINALGFAALADPEDIDLVFDEFDMDGGGTIDHKELNKMLRQSAAVDANMLGNNKRGEAAMRGEKEAKLRRHGGGGKGGPPKREKIKSVKMDSAAQVQAAAQALKQLRNLFSNDPAGMMELFREIDSSGDGLVSRTEFALAIRALGLNLPKPELGLLFRELDPDGSGEIEYHELRAALEGGGGASEGGVA